MNHLIRIASVVFAASMLTGVAGAAEAKAPGPRVPIVTTVDCAPGVVCTPPPCYVKHCPNY